MIETTSGTIAEGAIAAGDAAFDSAVEPALAVLAVSLSEIGVDLRARPRFAVLRRIARRMGVVGVPRIADYAQRVANDVGEARLLARELSQTQGLIFRDGELYAGLLRLLPGALAGAGRPQVWVPDCGRGEDVYAIGMLVAQALASRAAAPEFIVYGTDGDVDALSYAQRGRFPGEAVERVPAMLRASYLREDNGDWSVTPELRRHSVFLHHPLDAPPPFFDVDLIHCRQLLEGLDAARQRQLLEHLYRALRRDGLLVAGSLRDPAAYGDLFVPLPATPGLLMRVTGSQAPRKHGAPASEGAADWYAKVFESSRQPALILGRTGEVLRANRAALARFGGTAAARPLAELLAPQDQPAIAELLRGLAPGEDLETDVALAGGDSVRLHLAPLAAAADAPVYAEIVGGDGDEGLHARLTRARELVQTTLAALAEGVILIDREGSVLEFNPVAERLTGWRRDEAVGQSYARVFRLQTASGAPVADHPVDATLAGQPQIADRNDLYLRHRDGRRFALRLRLRAAVDDSVVLVFDDVSEMNLLTEELAYRATHDPLTGLLNRDEFEARARAAVAQAQASGVTAVLCYLDIDQFKVVNDTLGHAAGDELLHELAGELRSRIAERDAFARLGGDEFGVLLLGQDLQSARPAVESLLETARRFRFVWQGQSCAITLSVGAALIDRGAEDVARAMSMADAACFVAKDAGRDRVFFAGEDDELANRRVQMSMVGKIGRSLDDNRFVLHYEDVVSLAETEKIFYRELLVRMRDDEGRLLHPAAFIQAAERYFLMGGLDRWVMRHAFRGIARLPEDGIIYAVNLSGQSLGDQKFLDFVLAELDSSGVDPERICFEITETSAVSKLTEAVRFISRISDFGCRFALDDFGSGMASFSYLKNFTVDFLKIDGGFVRAMLDSRADRGMVESINRIGHQMGLKTIAEHVESPALFAPLREIGVDWAQGRAIGPGKAFDALMP